MEDQKPKVVFAFVEAGLGHIMPMNAICKAFERKYGGVTEIVKTAFFKDKLNPDMKFVEDELVAEVKRHNKSKFYGFMQFFLMRLTGARTSMKYLMEKRYKKGFAPSLDYIKELDARVIVNTHFSTMYYACEARALGLINAKVITYVPDPIIGRQWDSRADLVGLSSFAGERAALMGGRFTQNQLAVIPFLIREEVKDMTEGRRYYRKLTGLPEDNFTVLLADGAYGAGKLRDTVLALMKSKLKMTVVAVCGKNERLYKEFCGLKPPENIHFAPFGFTDKMLTLAACCDLFVGKAGASNLAEPSYFGAPSIVTFCATPIEKWICAHYVEYAGCAVKRESVKKAVKLIERWVSEPALMEPYREACKSQQRYDGAEIFADIIWQRLNEPVKGNNGYSVSRIAAFKNRVGYRRSRRNV
ncbi:MAG: hypothetical protein LBS99_07060 [Clostridiales bacterium]|jgi:UDP-N-acetylglucosamine:LPS N-acetylglucosamine transferase|nr:hypothetical protein [Clostridiales bacterium]